MLPLVELRMGSVAASGEPAIDMASFYVLDAMVTRFEGVTQLQALIEPVTVERSHRRRDWRVGDCGRWLRPRCRRDAIRGHHVGLRLLQDSL